MLSQTTIPSIDRYSPYFTLISASEGPLTTHRTRPAITEPKSWTVAVPVECDDTGLIGLNRLIGGIEVGMSCPPGGLTMTAGDQVDRFSCAGSWVSPL